MKLKPLLCRPALFSDETLASYLYRLSLVNAYTPGMVPSLCRERMPWQDSVLMPTRMETFTVLEGITMVPVQKLYGASSHCFAWFLAPPREINSTIHLRTGHEWPRLSPTAARTHLRPVTSAQYCPLCLAEEAYQRRAWILRAVAACLKHRCLLIDRCPGCDRRLGSINLVTIRCAGCGYTLTDGSITDLSNDGFGLQSQALVHYWAGVGPPEVSSVPPQPTSVLYDLHFALISAVFRVKDRIDELHPMPALQRPFGWVYQAQWRSLYYYVAGATAMQALLEWPRSFHAFLERYQIRDGRKFEQSINKNFGSFYTKWLLARQDYEAYDFVKNAFIDYLVTNYSAPVVNRSARFRQNPIPANRFTWMLVAEAKKALAVTPGTIKRLIEGGLITIRDETRASRFKFLARADVMALKQIWDEGMPLRDTALLLGVSEDVTLTMVRNGLLKAVRGPGVDGSAIWAISRPSVEELLEKVEVFTRSYKPRVGYRLDLIEATQMLAAHGFTTDKVIQWVIEGKLSYWYTAGSALNKLIFFKREVQALLDHLRCERDLIPRKQVAQMMGVKPDVIEHWVANGLLVPVLANEHGTLFEREAAELFVAEHVMSNEAAEILGVGELVVQKWARNGRLKPVSGPGVDNRGVYLFRREDVERLRPENRLTAPQMARHLGLSRSQLGEWIRKGKVKPMSGPGVDQCKHYLFLVED